MSDPSRARSADAERALEALAREEDLLERLAFYQGCDPLLKVVAQLLDGQAPIAHADATQEHPALELGATLIIFDGPAATDLLEAFLELALGAQ